MLSFTTFQLFCFRESPGHLHKLTEIFRLQLLATAALPAEVSVCSGWSNLGILGKHREEENIDSCVRNPKKLDFTGRHDAGATHHTD